MRISAPNPNGFLVLFALCICGCASPHQGSKIIKLELNGVRNVYRLSPRILTGGQPESEAGFAELEHLGVKTIISVTDTPPQEAAAKRHGMSYVHVPMTYEGVSPEQEEKILQAAGASSGPVYIHCNSGRNRGATAAGICLIGLEGRPNQEAIDWMKMRGVEEKHQALYDDVRNFKPDSKR